MTVFKSVASRVRFFSVDTRLFVVIKPPLKWCEREDRMATLTAVTSLAGRHLGALLLCMVLIDCASSCTDIRSLSIYKAADQTTTSLSLGR